MKNTKNPFKPYPPPPAQENLIKSHTILMRTHDAAWSFLTLFENSRQGRKGVSTDPEQDLLRAMLVFACAGLDSMIKQVIRDALEPIIYRDEGTRKTLRAYVEKRLTKQGTLDPKFLSEVLTGTDPQKVLITMIIEDLTSQSLQSKDQVMRAASFFDIPSDTFKQNIKILDEIFQCRNQISHEMDVDFYQKNRNRRQRAKGVMIDYTKNILKLADIFLSEVGKKL